MEYEKSKLSIRNKFDEQNVVLCNIENKYFSQSETFEYVFDVIVMNSISKESQGIFGSITSTFVTESDKKQHINLFSYPFLEERCSILADPFENKVIT